MIPSNGHPSYLQLYFYNTDHEIDNRIHISDSLNLEILSQLIDLLEINSYCSFFCSLNNISNVKDHQVVIRSDSGLDQCIYNAPSSSQVATIWLENDQTSECTERDIIVYSHSGFCHKVQHYYGCYYPSQYPLLFPFGDMGWHQGIKKIDKTRRGSSCKSQSLINPFEITSVDDLIENEAQGRSKIRI